MSSADQVARRLESIPRVVISEAVFVAAVGDGSARVDFGQGAVVVAASGVYDPTPGSTVRVLQVDDRTVILGPSVPRAGRGVITATGSPNLTVDAGNGNEQLPVLEPYSADVVPQIGDQVVIDRSTGFVIGRVGNLPENDYGAPAEGSGGGVQSRDFRASDTGTFYVPGGRWARDDVYAVGTTNNIGAFFYGSTIADTIPDNAPIRRVQIYMSEQWNKYPGTATQLGLHDQRSRGGKPDVTGAVGVGSGSGWRDLPLSFGDALRNGNKFGIGTAPSGEALYRSRGADADSGLLRIEYGN